ncbi:MAG TPA: VWA domain-containing protein [Terracidiphilus sp.]|jgi:VWFA-related protein|nr:VWA domain-containing protein [Terracidiphilus sp.]
MTTISGYLSKGAGFLLLALLPAAGAARAQDEGPSVIRSTTRLVQLNVTVLDKQHRPMSRLSQGDFHVFDNGVEQKIVHFSAGPGTAPPRARSRLAISNRPAPSEESPGVTVILMDETLLDAPAGVPLDVIAPIRSARLAVLDFLAGLQPGEQVALYSLRSQGVIVIHDFTDDPAALIAAAKALGAGGMGRAANAADVRRLAGGALRDWSRYPSVRTGGAGYGGNVQERAALLRGGFQQIVEHLRGVPGRKNLVWISSALPGSTSGVDLNELKCGRDANVVQPTLDNQTPIPQHPSPENYYVQLRDFARWLGTANISVYPIDAKGLTVKGSSVEEWSAADMIAAETGGQAIFDSNALDRHLHEIVAQSGGSYQIGYYPGNAAWNGKYHHVEVKVLPSREGMTVLCRKGYYAADQAVSDDTDAPLNQAATSVVESAGVGITVNVKVNPLEPGPEDIVLKLDSHDIYFEHTDGRSKASLDVAFVQIGRDGRVVNGHKDRILVSLTPKMYDAATRVGWFYRKNIRIEPRAEKLRVVVRDLATGAIGSVSVPVHSLNFK